jgi:hypothetical protein
MDFKLDCPTFAPIPLYIKSYHSQRFVHTLIILSLATATLDVSGIRCTRSLASSDVKVDVFEVDNIHN